MKSIRQLWEILTSGTEKSRSMSQRVHLDQPVYRSRNGQLFFLSIGTPKEVLSMVEIQKLCYDGKTPWNASSLFQDIHNNKDALYLILKYEEQPVGFVAAWFTGREAHITNLAVIPAFQRQGLATYLLQEIQSITQAEKKDRLTLEVRVSNEKAKQLYHQIGFVPGRIKKAYYMPDHEDALEMTMKIERANSPHETRIRTTS